MPKTTVSVGVYACPTCCVPLCFQDEVQTIYSSYVRVNLLHVVNILKVVDSEAFCILDHFIGRMDGDSLFLYRPVRLTVAPRADAIDGAHPREWVHSRGTTLLPVWGCICCRRPIGVGYDFMLHFAQPIALVNAAQCSTDSNVIRCVCGCYLGYYYRNYVLIGEITELTS